MIQRVMPELMGMKNILVLNDEAHHCYREKPGEDTGDLKGDEKKEAEKNNEAARMWISGLEAVNRKLGVTRVIDLSATPFFLRGSGYAEGTLFPWTMNDFSLMDAIECGIVKLPRVPVADNIPGDDMPRFRNLWESIGKKMPKKGRGRARHSTLLVCRSSYRPLWKLSTGTTRRPSTSGRRRHPLAALLHRRLPTTRPSQSSSTTTFRDSSGRMRMVRRLWRTVVWRYSATSTNTATRWRRPRTLLIDSEQLESGDALDANFRAMASDEIDRFRREVIERTGDRTQAESMTDQDLLREVMNTVGKEGRLGDSIRCVVSVSMLTEGWDARNVTHVLGVRAFGTQLLCEQVIGRALRRQSYDLNEEGLFSVEYADILGIPFDFTAKPVIAPLQPPRETVHVMAMRPERDGLEIRFPHVHGYRVELPAERLTAEFNDDDSTLELTPDLVGPSVTKNSGIIGEGVDLNLVHTGDLRRSTIILNLTSRLLYTKWRDVGEDPKLYLFGQLKRITRQWMDSCLVCSGGTYPAQLMYQELADMACERITAGITRSLVGESPVKAVLDPYNPTGSTIQVNFTTSRKDRWETDSRRCHINWVILDSDWEAEFCRVAEAHPNVSGVCEESQSRP